MAFIITERCVKCGACKNICKFNVGVYGNYDLEVDVKKGDQPVYSYIIGVE